MYSTEIKRPRVLLVGVQYPNISDEEHQASLKELERLVDTLDFECVETFSQRRKSPEKGTVLGEGKVMELAEKTGGTGKIQSLAKRPKNKLRPRKAESEESKTEIKEEEQIDKVIFDEELTPMQLRNLESATGVEVLDRTGVIIEIFYRHAKTREAQIQVDIARLRYLSPRLRFSRLGQDRQGGGIGMKGIGETAYELDKRRVRDRIAELKRELADIHRSQGFRRLRRKDKLKVALIGYTNAGKSSLMRALTERDAYVENKLFATLDTTLRVMKPEEFPRVLISDTVGFIKKLPHDLVASFRSTLDEASDASLLLYIVDASDSNFASQLEVTRKVISDLKIDSPYFLVFNKVDLLENSALEEIKEEFPEAIMLSAHAPEDIERLRKKLLEHFEKDMMEAEILIPYAKSEMLGSVRENMKILSESSTQEGVLLKVLSHKTILESAKKEIDSL